MTLAAMLLFDCTVCHWLLVRYTLITKMLREPDKAPQSACENEMLSWRA